MRTLAARLVRSGYLGCAFLIGMTVVVWQFPGWLASRSGSTVQARARVDCLAWSPDGTLLASGSRESIAGRLTPRTSTDPLNRVDVWEPRTGRLRTSLRGQKGPVSGVTFSADGRLLVAASRQEVRTWDVVASRLFRQAPWSSLSEAFLGFSPDGSRAATSMPGQLIVWDMATGRARSFRSQLDDPLRAAAFSADGRLVAAAGRVIRIWDIATGALRETVGRPGVRLTAVALTRDGLKVATGAEDGSVDVWDVDNGRVEHLLLGHTASIRAIAFSPDGKLLATGSGEFRAGQTWGEIRLWDADTGALKRRLTGHSDVVSSLAFSPRGEWLASGSFDTTVRVWKVG